MSVFAHLEDKTTATPSVCDAITLMSSIILILRKEKIYFPSFDLSSPTSDLHDESEFLCISLRLNALNREQASSLHIRYHHNLKSSLDAAMLFDEKSTRQRFSGVETYAVVMKTLSGDMVFWYVYLH